MNNGRLWLVLLAVFAGAPSGALALSAKDVVAGQTEEVRGGAVARRAAAQRELAPPSEVFVGETLQTAEKSRAQFKLGRDTTLRMGAETRVRLDRMLIDKGGTIVVDSGPILIDKTPGTGDRPLELKGGFGLIVVRGTRLFAGPSNGTLGVFVEHGEIEVTSGGRSVVLHDGQGVDILRKGAPPTNVKSWGAKRIEAALNSVQ